MIHTIQETRTIEVPARSLALCGVKAELAANLTRDETTELMNWCDCQTEDLWEGMTLQEILNVYRVSADYVTWEGWAEEDRKAAYKAWNRAVIDAGNKMMQS